MMSLLDDEIVEAYMHVRHEQSGPGLDPFIFFGIFKFKFKFIDFEKAKFKFKFIDFAKVEFKFKFINNS